MKKIRLGFIGTGNMGQMAHLRNYMTLPHCEVVALAELRPQLAAQVGARFGIPEVYHDHEELLAKAKVDALVMIQPFWIHGGLLPAVLAHGKPIMIEKPLAHSVEIAQHLSDLSAKHHAPIYVAYHKRSDLASVAAAEKIREWKASGKFGQMRYVRVTMPPGKWDAEGFASRIVTDEKYPEVKNDAPPAGFDKDGAHQNFLLVNFYIHQINLLRYLLGEDFTVTTADANGQYMGIRSASGVSGILEMAPYHTTLDWQESALVGFDKGYLHLDLPAPMVLDRPGRLRVFEDLGGTETPKQIEPVFAPWHAMRSQAANFVRAVAGEKTPLCTAQDATKDLEIARDFLHLQQKGAGIKLSF
ncbi:MAG: putative dehydrogenase [Verrucomicrobia bacterium]|nr:putative dehydrogenase [Verrucomicrobiota bacterium]